MKKVADLTADQIETIGAVLHSNMQFYGRSDEPDNSGVITEIEKVLTENPLSAE